MDNEQGSGPEVYLIDGARTPFIKARGKPGPFSASDLALYAARTLLLRHSFSPEAIEEVITGCVMPSCDEANISRIIALRLGCGHQVPAWTVQRNCASGLQAIDNAWQDIRMGRHDLVLAGGCEAMSHAPLLFNEKMVKWFAAMQAARTPLQRVKLLPRFRPSYLMPVISLLRGLTDPTVALSMGQTAENLAYRFGIDRQAMDEFACESHMKLAAAMDNGHFNHELTTIYDSKQNFYAEDDGLRRDSSVEKLAKLKPFFDRKFGMVTPGNSSQVTDGAAFMLLASKKAVKKYQLPVVAKIIDCQWAGVDPAQMGLGPVHAISQLLKQQSLSMNDIDYWEINEAFAAQVIACTKAMADGEYCKKELGLDAPLGQLDPAKLNVDGGAIAMGHPVGASGARLVLQLNQILQRQKGRYGIASLCIGGGQGGAMLIERVTEVQG